MDFGSQVSSPETDACRIFRDLSTPAVHLLHQPRPARSQLGGVPEAPAGFHWPMHGPQPLSFLGRLDLAQLRLACLFDWLPPSGDLLFFYDTQTKPDGHDPAHFGAWRVFYLSSEEVNLRRVAPPLPTEPRTACVFRRGIRTLPRHAKQFPRIPLRPRLIETMPNWEDRHFPLDLHDAATEIISEQLRPRLYRNLPRHQVGGFCDPIQSPDMDLQCALVSRGLRVPDADLPGIRPNCDAPLRREAEQWRLLLQIDSDDRLRLHWPEAGMVYFWIREEDARARRFDRVWVIRQSCS